MPEKRDLTNTDAISYLLQVKEGDTMKGVIRTKEFCSVWQDSFIEIKKLVIYVLYTKSHQRDFLLTSSIKAKE